MGAGPANSVPVKAQAARELHRIAGAYACPIRLPGSPVLRAKLEELAGRVKQIGKAKLAFPMNHAAMPLSAKELIDLGVGYCHVSPPPPAVLLRSMRDRVQNIYQEIGRE